jgi:hypothetical protein
MRTIDGGGPGPCATKRGKLSFPFARTVRIGLTSMVLLVLGGATAKAACNYYASPTGTGNGLSASSPFQISKFWPLATPGKTLCLLDGTYTDSKSMIVPPQGLNGASGIPITIRALNEGKVLINAKFSRSPIRLVDNDWFVIEGVNACCGYKNTSVVGIYHANNNVIRRVAAWDAKDDNSSIFGVHYGLYNLLEDVAGWGTARKIFSNSQGGDYTTVRRAWGRWERSTVVGPKTTYSLAYNSHHMTCENCLGTWSGQGMPQSYDLLDYNRVPVVPIRHYTNYGVESPYGIFQANRKDGDKNVHIRLLGSLAYVQATDKYKSPYGIFITRLSSVEVKDTTVRIAPGTNLSVRPFALYGELAGQTNLRATDLTSFGGASAAISSPWVKNNVWSGTSPAAYSSGENIFNTSRGANLCYRYEKGNLTNKPLWPWPMNQRIRDAMVQSGRSSVDVTATVQSIFGKIPAACSATAIQVTDPDPPTDDPPTDDPLTDDPPTDDPPTDDPPTDDPPMDDAPTDDPWTDDPWTDDPSTPETPDHQNPTSPQRPGPRKLPARPSLPGTK